ncbi:hypothetical protein PoB_004699800 [Plakobranchus ocellatus]|uniref:Uncharacterized protein n=1 Tax=Plakobranchus ocellatus TaxID=259542 RepID=A0AAV4BMY3_9GAST|nr:hypothetical protein PoB_004699800 [Plakobranchus ocellatus]
MSCACPPTSPVRVFVISSARNVPSLLRVFTISPTRPPPPPLRILGHLPCVFLLPALRILHHFLYMSSAVCSSNPPMTPMLNASLSVLGRTYQDRRTTESVDIFPPTITYVSDHNATGAPHGTGPSLFSCIYVGGL